MIKNNFWNNTIIYGAGFLLLRGISFFLLPVYTNLLSEYDAGLIFLIYTLLAFLNPVYAYGMNAALFKFSNNKDYSSVSITTTSLISLLISSSLFSCLLILFSPYLNFLIDSGLNSTYTVNWFFWLALILFFDSVSARIFVLLRVQQKPYYFLFISTVNIVLSLTFNFLFIKHCLLGSFGAVLALFLVSSIQVLLLIPILIRVINFYKFNIHLFKKMFSFAVPFLPSALLFVVIGFSDRWFIKYYLNMESVGIYGAGYKLGSIMSLAVTAFNLNWQPYYLKTNNNKNNQFGEIGNIAIVGFVGVFTLLIFFIKDIVTINWNGQFLIGRSFWGGLSVVPYVALGYLFYGIYILQMPSIFLLNKQKWGLLFWVGGAVVNIIGNAILIPEYGILGASIATALGYFIMMIWLLYKNQKWINIVYNYQLISTHIIISMIVLFVNALSFPLSFLLGILYLFYVFLLIFNLQKKINLND